MHAKREEFCTFWFIYSSNQPGKRGFSMIRASRLLYSNYKKVYAIILLELTEQGNK